MDEYGLVLMLMAFGGLCGLSGYSFGYAQRDNEVYAKWVKDNEAMTLTEYEQQKAWEIATGSQDEVSEDWSNWK
jgi:hypothetical protein